MKGTRYSELQIFAVLRQAEGGVRLFDEDVVWMATASINRNLISALVKIVIQPAPMYWSPLKSLGRTPMDIIWDN